MVFFGWTYRYPCVLDGTVNAHVYRNDIFDVYAFYAGAIANNFLLQEDNARLHTALIVEHYLQRMEWPSESLDKNLIECVWDILRRCDAALNPPPNQCHAYN